MTTKMKKCSCCGGVFPLEQFGKNVQTPDGRSYYCRNCARAKQRQFREANDDLVKAARARYLDKLRARNRAHVQDGNG